MLIARSGTNRRIEERFYFSRLYNSWHGSPEWQDSGIPIVVARVGGSGAAIRGVVDGVLSDPPSQLDITPLVLRLLEQP